MRNDNDEFDFNELNCDMATEYIEDNVSDVCEMWNKYCDEEGSDWDKFYKFDDLAEMFPPMALSINRSSSTSTPSMSCRVWTLGWMQSMRMSESTL